MYKNTKAWPDKLPETLWAYRATVRTVTQETPYSLVFRGETIYPLEIQLLLLRVIIHEEMTNGKVQLTFRVLEALDNERLVAQQNLDLY